jgi:uncharacterized protein with LGFP repeats
MEVLEERLVMTSQTAIDAINADWAKNPWLGAAVDYYQDTADGVGSWRDYSLGSIYWSSSSGAHEIDGLIKIKWLALGGVNFGFPTTDETPTPDRVGKYNHFQKLQPWGMDQYAIDWTQQYGACELDGLIAQKFFRLGAENFGEAITNETPTPDGVGYYNHFEKKQPWGLDTWYAIDWTRAYGAHEVHGLIGQKFFSLGAENFGEAISDEGTSPDNFAQYNHFVKQLSVGTAVAAIDWTTEYGAHAVWGEIAARFQNLGWEAFGEAITDEADFTNGSNLPPYAAYARFQFNAAGGPTLRAIDYTVQNGAHIVYGAIYEYFMSHGGELGPFGFAISDETDGNGPTRMNLFQNGEIQSDPNFWGAQVILSVYKLNSITVRFSWKVNIDDAAFSLVRWGLVGNADGEDQQDMGSGVAYDISNLNPGYTYIFTVDPYSSGLTGNYYYGWTPDLIYTLT